MPVTGTLPHLDDCLDAYLRAYEQFGTEPFVPDELSVPGEAQPESLLDLAVAYGLLEYDGNEYRVRVAPDAPAERWNAAATSRATAIRRRMTSRDTDERVGQPDEESGRERLQRDGRHYASVFVDERDGFEAVTDRVHEAVTADDVDGVVLRSSGQLANEVQQFADRLCDQETVTDGPSGDTFRKDDSDVEGDHKDDLEFRLYLIRR